MITGEAAVKLRKSGLPLPAALGIFSGFGDFARLGDSASIYGIFGLSGPLFSDCSSCVEIAGYVGKTDRRDPVLSPVFADLKGFPPTLFLTSTRDITLSGTTILHRAFLKAGVNAELVVFEALTHAFWEGPFTMPEAVEANQMIATFFDRQLGRARR